MKIGRSVIVLAMVASVATSACGGAVGPGAAGSGSADPNRSAAGSPSATDATPSRGDGGAPIVFFRDGAITDEALAQLVVGGKVDSGVAADLVTAFGQLSAAEQATALQVVSARYEVETARVSGLVDAIGDEGAAVAAIGAAWAPARAAVETFDPSNLQLKDAPPAGGSAGDEPVAGRDGAMGMLASYRGAGTPREAGFDANDPGASVDGLGLIGIMLGGALMSAAADAVISAANGLTAADARQEGAPLDGKAGTGMQVGESLAQSSMKMDYTGDQDGVAVKFHAEMVAEPCPDPNGRLSLSAKLDISTSKGTTGARTTIDMKILGQVDDDARLAGKQTETQMQTSSFGAGEKGQFLDFTLSSGTGRDLGYTMNRTGGAVTSGLVRMSLFMALMFEQFVGDKLVTAAEKAWSSGRCVELKVAASPGPRNLTPSSTSTITAAPHSRIDGASIGGTVTATLTAGTKSVEPGGKVKADATFTYTAPDERDLSGTVDFESRSRRGVGKASMTLDTKSMGWVASGGSAAISFSGTVADLSKPFTLTAAYDIGTGTFDYSPTDEKSGTLTLSGSGPGFTFSGKGTYTISGNASGPLTLTQTHVGCVSIAGCHSNTDVITLTPAK